MEKLDGMKDSRFLNDLKRSFKDIKASRAESVAEDVELVYKRKIEDLCHQLRGYTRERENLILDLSPANAFSTHAVNSDFNASEFMNKDLQIGKNVRLAKIELEIVLDRYEYLFGHIADTAAITRVLPEWTTKLKD